MLLAVKYCGGCNSSYDRVALVEELQRDFPDIRIVAAEGLEEEADMVLVVCGCPAACAAHGHLRGKHGKVIVSNAGEFRGVREKLRK